MTKAQFGARIRAKKKINADLSPTPTRKRRKVADPAKEARSQGVALFSDDENDELAPLDMQTQRNVWEGLREKCNTFIELPTHMDPLDADAMQKSKLAWIQLKKDIENALFLMNSRRIIISKGLLKELDLGRLLYECCPNAPEKKPIKDLLFRLKAEMAKVVKKREQGFEAGAAVTEDDMNFCVKKFTEAFNRIDHSTGAVPESLIAEYAQKQADACQAVQGNFAKNRDQALDTWNGLALKQRTKLLKGHFDTNHWNFANLINQQRETLISTISNQVGNIILETTNGPVLGTAAAPASPVPVSRGVSNMLEKMRRDTYESAQDKENLGNGWHETVYGGGKSSASSRRGSFGDMRKPLGESNSTRGGSLGSLSLAGVATSAAKESNVSRLSGGSDMRSTPGIVFQMQELAPPSSATKHRGGKSHADIVKKAERNRAKELKEAAKKHKEEAARRERRAERDRQKKKRAEDKAKPKERYAEKLKKDKEKSKKAPPRSRSPSL